MSAGFFKGTTSDQAGISNAERKLMQKLNFAPILKTKVSACASLLSLCAQTTTTTRFD